MLKILKILTSKTNFILQKNLENVYTGLQVQAMYTVNKTLFSAEVQSEEVSQETSEDDKVVLDFFLKQQCNTGKKVTVILQDLLKIHPKEAIDIVSKHKKFYQTPWSLLDENYKMCLDQGLQRKHLLAYPDILADPRLYEKIQILNNFSEYKLDILLPLVRLPMKNVRLLSDKEKWLKKIEDVSKVLQVSKQKACELFASKPFLFNLNLETIESTLKLLEEKNISKMEILNDLWILKYSPYLIQSRLDYANNEAVVPKTWMVRCKSEILENHIKRTKEQRGLLGDSSVAKYLSERLYCSEEMAKYIIDKLPALGSKNLTRINKMIDFLVEKGITFEQICRMPKILLHSVETTKKRLQEIEAISTKKDYLYILTKSKKQYQQHLEALAKSHGKKLT